MGKENLSSKHFTTTVLLKILKCCILAFGIIKKNVSISNENQFWPVSSNCESVHITSKHFKTRLNVDVLIIDGIEYSGENTTINQIVPSNFTISYQSNYYKVCGFDEKPTTEYSGEDGFNLLWNCTVIRH